ncbi:MAG: tape measure protein, partial [Alphaproteobacteria bacterium]
MAAAERAVTEIVFDAGPAEAGARRVERAGKTIIDTNRSVSTAVGKAAEEQAKSQERSARATEMAAAAMRAAQSAIQTTASVALARSHEAISAAIAIARRDYAGLAVNAAELSEKQSTAAASTNALTRALTALGLAVGVQQYINFVDSMALLNARIGLVTKSTNEYLTAQRAVYTIAQDAAQPIEDLGNLYAKVQESLTPLGKSQGEALRMTETISKAMRVGGGAAAAQQAALVQLGQAFSAGALRGEELNSVIEGSPRLARAIAEGMGIARGELKKYAEEGKITSEAIANAMRSQREVIEREFATLPTTVSAEMTRLNNAVMVAMSQLDKSAGISGTIGALVNDLTAKLEDPKFLDQVGAILNRLGSYARIAADAIGFLVSNLDGALLAFAAFSGAKG